VVPKFLALFLGTEEMLALSAQSHACSDGSGSRMGQGFCGVWSTVLTPSWCLVQQCPRWTTRAAPGMAAMAGTLG
jgi:hypothetical protein